MGNDYNEVDESNGVVEERKPSFFKRHKKLVVVAIVAGVVSAIVGGIAASAVPPGGQSSIQCQQVNSTIGPDGHVVLTLDCTITAPTATPTGTPSATASATASATPSGTPSATTPAPTTPAPTTSSPSPTPTATGTALKLKNCFSQLAACGYPTPATTGPPAGTVLTPYTGPSTISTAGTVIDGKAMGCVRVTAKNVIIRNSTITGPCFYGVEVTSGGSLTIQRSRIDCVNYTGTGLVWGNFQAYGIHFRRCENALSTTSNVLLQDSYISEIVEKNGGHGDGLQAESGSNLTIRHNTFDIRNPITSSIEWVNWVDDNTINHTLVEDNFFAAGAFTVYCQAHGTDAIFRNNRFYAPVGNWQSDTHRPAYGFTDSCNQSFITWTGNYRDDTLGVVTSSS